MLLKSFIRVFSSIFVLVIISGIVFSAGGYWYFTRTMQGAKWLFDFAAKRYLQAETVIYDQFDGTLNSGIQVSNIQMTGVAFLNQPGDLLVQRLNMEVTGLGMRHLWIKVYNGRIKYPVSDPIGFYGILNQGILNFHLYSGVVDIREMTTLFTEDLSLRNLQGTGQKVSMTINGLLEKPILRGEFFLQDLKYLGFGLRQMPVKFGFTLSRQHKSVNWEGTLSVASGDVISRLTTVKLQESKLIFQGPFKNPALDLHGSSKVEQTMINITLVGTKQKPDMRVTSNPSKNKNVLLMMLATGQEIKLPEKVFEDGSNAADVDRDFVDFFTFNSDGGVLSNAFGLSDFSVQMDGNARGLGIKRRVNDQIKVGVNVQEIRDATGENPNVTRSVGGEVQVMDNITVGVDKKVTQQPTSGGLQDPSSKKANNEEVDVMIKYKKNF